jgi:hypothetical protein
MTSRTTRQFRALLNAFPNSVRKPIGCFEPHHPGLRFKKVNDDPVSYSARVGIGYRALAAVKGNTAVWFWIGSHADYDTLLATL